MDGRADGRMDGITTNENTFGKEGGFGNKQANTPTKS